MSSMLSSSLSASAKALSPLKNPSLLKEDIIEIFLTQNIELVKESPHVKPFVRINGQAIEIQSLFNTLNKHTSLFGSGLTRGAVYFGLILYKLENNSNLLPSGDDKADFKTFTRVFTQFGIEIPDNCRTDFQKYRPEFNERCVVEDYQFFSTVKYHSKSFRAVTSENFLESFKKGDIHTQRRLLKEACALPIAPSMNELMECHKLVLPNSLLKEFQALFLHMMKQDNGFNTFLTSLNLVPTDSLENAFALFNLNEWNTELRQEINKYLDRENTLWPLSFVKLIQKINWSNESEQLKLAKGMCNRQYWSSPGFLKELVQIMQSTPWTSAAQMYLSRAIDSLYYNPSAVEEFRALAQCIGNIKWTSPQALINIISAMDETNFGPDSTVWLLLAEFVGKIEEPSNKVQDKLAETIFIKKFGHNTAVLLKLVESIGKIKWTSPQAQLSLAQSISLNFLWNEPVVKTALFHFGHNFQWTNPEAQSIWMRALQEGVFKQCPESLEARIQSLGLGAWREEDQERCARAIYDVGFGKEPHLLKLLAQKIGTLQWSQMAQTSLIRSIFEGKWGNDPEVSAQLELAVKSIQWTERSKGQWIGNINFPPIPLTNTILIQLIQFSAAIKWSQALQKEWVHTIATQRFGQNSEVLIKLLQFIGTMDLTSHQAQILLCDNIVFGLIGNSPEALTQFAKSIASIKWTYQAQLQLGNRILEGYFGDNPAVMSELILSISKINWTHPIVRKMITTKMKFPDAANGNILTPIYKLNAALKEKVREWIFDYSLLIPSMINRQGSDFFGLRNEQDFDAIYTDQFYNPASFLSFLAAHSDSQDVREYLELYEQFKNKLNDLGIEIEESNHTFMYKKNGTAYFLVAEKPIGDQIQNFIPGPFSYLIHGLISDANLQLFQFNGQDVIPAGSVTVKQDMPLFPIFMQEILHEYHENRGNPSLAFYDLFMALPHVIPAEAGIAQGASAASVAAADFQFNSDEIKKLKGMFHHALTQESIFSNNLIQLKKKYNNYLHVLPDSHAHLLDLKNKIMREFCTVDSAIDIERILFAAFSLGRAASSTALGWHEGNDNASNSFLRSLSSLLFKELDERIAPLNAAPWSLFKPILRQVLAQFPQDVCLYAVMSRVYSPYAYVVSTPVQEIISRFYGRRVD